MGKFSKTAKSQSNNKVRLKCQHCDKEFKYESERKRHEQSHSPQFSCKVCSKKFSFMSALRRHEKQHERTGSVNCDECQRKFRDDSLLKRHIQYAHKGTFVCGKCTSIFNSDLALRSHMKTHNAESERRYRCSFEGCSKTFNFAHHLRHHELTHTNTKQHFCVVCGKGFIQYHHLKSHLKRHNPDNLLHCSMPFCKETFATEYDLENHFTKHKNTFGSNVSSDCESQCDATNTSSDFDEYKCDGSATDASFPDLEIMKKDSRDFDLEMQDLKLQSRCSLYDVNINANNDGPNRKNVIPLQKSSKLQLKEPAPTNICNPYLSGCNIDSVECDQKPFCNQMSYPIEDTYDIVANMLSSSVKPKIVKIKTDEVNPKSCASCSCKSSNNTGCSSKETLIYESVNQIDDVVEYKPDGTVKIKEAFDMDLDLSNSNDKVKRNSNDSVPFNSCKEVLGNCIVSGNGTIGEGCLCAKMAVDDQPMIEQEIDELTPCPKM